MLEEFKKFAMRGNVVDLAVGVIIGVAFGAIVNSLVGDIIMPIIGAVTGGLDFSNYFIQLSSKVTADSLAEAKKQGAVLAWGNFLTDRDQLPHHRLGAVHDGAAHEPADAEGGRQAAGPEQAGRAADRNPRPSEGARRGA